MQPESPYLSSDGTSWNGEAMPDTVKAALTGPMGKVSSPGAAEALNALYQSLVLTTGGTALIADLIQQVSELDRVAVAEGTDPGDAKALQKASKLVRTLFAIPDQADLDRAQDKANQKAKSLGGASTATGETEGVAEDAGEPADAESTEAVAPADAAPTDGATTDPRAEELRKRVHV